MNCIDGIGGIDGWGFFKTICWIIACVIWYHVGKLAQSNKKDDLLEKEVKGLTEGWLGALTGWRLSNEKLQWAYDHLSKKNQKLYDEEFKEDVEDKE